MECDWIGCPDFIVNSGPIQWVQINSWNIRAEWCTKKWVNTWGKIEWWWWGNWIDLTIKWRIASCKDSIMQ